MSLSPGADVTIVHDNRFIPISPESAAKAADNVLSYALVILNGKAGAFLPHLWKGAAVCVTADGGTNRAYQFFSEEDRSEFIPDVIIGDMDSARPDVVDYYRQKGSTVLKLESQDNTDMMKALDYLHEQESNGRFAFDLVVCYGGFGGRLDQELGNINTLFLFRGKFKRLLMLSEGNSAELLTPGRHIIHCHGTMEARGVHCGLLPIGGPCQAHSTGLEWNVSGHSLAFGGLVSACNVIQGDTVEVRTDEPLVWTSSFGELVIEDIAKERRNHETDAAT